METAKIEMLKEIVQMVLGYGLTGFLLIALLLIIHDPDRAEKLKALIIKPLFFLFKWGSREYVAAEVGSKTTEFFNKHIRPFMPSMIDIKVKIKWVTSIADPILSEDGTLILRLEETNDQTRNILAATQIALPHVVCPILRQNIEQYAQTAIDLALLRNLAEKLGRHARPIFQRYFLNPEIEKNREVANLLVKLIKLDDNGMFLTIFLEELNTLGHNLYDDADTFDKTNELLSFLEYLLNVANREIGEEICLEYLSTEIRVGITLLAITKKAEKQGVAPYVQAIDVNLQKGCDSLYIIAYHGSHEFSKRLVNAVEGDIRLSVVKTSKILVKRSDITNNNSNNIELTLLRRNNLSSDNNFDERLAALAIKEGSLVKGRVLDVSQCVTFVDVSGLNAVIYKNECSWRTVSECKQVLSVGSTYQFIVQSIDKNKHRLNLSLRFPEKDPWKSKIFPKEEDIVEVNFISYSGPNYISLYRDDIEILIPKHEVSWLGSDLSETDGLLNSRQKIIIYEKSIERRVIKGSLRRLEQNPWPKIHKRLPKGKELRAIVQDVTPEFVRVSLPEGLIGYIPRDEMVQGGFEYADFEKNVVRGQGLNVVVSKVFIDRQRIRLSLKRVAAQQKK